MTRISSDFLVAVKQIPPEGEQHGWHMYSGRGRLPLSTLQTHQPVTIAGAISQEMRAHLLYISERRAWLSPLISTDASMAILSTALIWELRHLHSCNCGTLPCSCRARRCFSIFMFMQPCAPRQKSPSTIVHTAFSLVLFPALFWRVHSLSSVLHFMSLCFSLLCTILWLVSCVLSPCVALLVFIVWILSCYCFFSSFPNLPAWSFHFHFGPSCKILSPIPLSCWVTNVIIYWT